MNGLSKCGLSDLGPGPKFSLGRQTSPGILRFSTEIFFVQLLVPVTGVLPVNQIFGPHTPEMIPFSESM